jgi:tRNA(Ile)-lysidine synthase
MTAARWNRLALRVRRRHPWQGDVGAGVVASTGAGVFILRRAGTRPRGDPDPLDPTELPLDIPGAVERPGGRVVVTLDPSEPRDETVDLDRLFPPLWVRAPLPGDRFNPLGMGDRATPLNDFFRGRHVVPADRARTPLVCDRFGIVWVVGHRIAHRVRITDRTTRPAGLRWEPSSTPDTHVDHPPPFA